jgi:hypothetical protein
MTERRQDQNDKETASHAEHPTQSAGMRYLCFASIKAARAEGRASGPIAQ